MSRTSRRPLARAGAVALLAASLLTGCAQEEPTGDADLPSSAAPTSEEVETTTEAAVTSEPPVADDESVTSSAPPAEEEAPVAVTSADQSFTADLPAGWVDAMDLVDDENVQLAGRAPEQVDGFFPNILVTQEEYVSNLTSAVEETAEQLAGEDGEYELLEPAEVDGNRAPGYTIVREVQGRSLAQTQRWISHDGTLYVVTLSAPEADAQEAAPLLDSLLASWTWQD
ncbi:hypothetical protein [Ornithinimicrobium cerasi]|uniref:DUF1795 domain-containing protein n=1 Tax=Ornithinimicrobium cerasi TaxID=2248773 RepID=A0A285VNM1_9MICO|nr:hypothetical protein [Ornithinimicrobium cerasi]SOC55655.1 hypothetical protein SAMN05421879_105193 [Ornithinimicrobium cerasi]